MESLCNYASDDDNSTSPKRDVTTKLTRSNGMEADANYEQVTMDMSEQESNHSSIKSPKVKDRTSPSSSESSTSTSRSPRSHMSRKHRNHSETKTSSSDEEKIKSRSRHRRNKSKDRRSKKHYRRSKSRSGGRKRSRRSRSRSHSHIKKRSRRSRSRSRSERNSSSRRSSPYSRHESKNHKKPSRSKSKEKYVSSHDYFLEKKANSKRLNKLGIELKVPTVGSSTLPSTTPVTPQQLLQKSMEAQVEKVKVQTGIELPSYYNPVAVNPNKYAEQIQKRKLLWGNKQNNDVVTQVVESKPTVTTTNKTATIWQSTKFGDQDGKVTAKFKRLMGIKDIGTGVDSQTSHQGQTKDIIKKQEEMFSSMESQYEVARMATHTHRGLGLGFGTFQQR